MLIIAYLFLLVAGDDDTHVTIIVQQPISTSKHQKTI